jgi:hypothetical protein
VAHAKAEPHPSFAQLTKILELTSRGQHESLADKQSRRTAGEPHRAIDVVVVVCPHQSVPLWAAKPLSAERKRLTPPEAKKEANFFLK